MCAVVLVDECSQQVGELWITLFNLCLTYFELNCSLIYTASWCLCVFSKRIHVCFIQNISCRTCRTCRTNEFSIISLKLRVSKKIMWLSYKNLHESFFFRANMALQVNKEKMYLVFEEYSLGTVIHWFEIPCTSIFLYLLS